jgi:hypothetical protein
MSETGRYFLYSPPGHSFDINRYDRKTDTRISSFIGNDQSHAIGISNDGRTALAWGTTTGYRIWKPLTDRFRRFDQALGGGYANGQVFADALSADGRVVMFDSAARTATTPSSPRGRRTWSAPTPTGRSTCSYATGRITPPAAAPSRRAEPRQTSAPWSVTCRWMERSPHSFPGRRTSCQTTSTAQPTSSSAGLAVSLALVFLASLAPTPADGA